MRRRTVLAAVGVFALGSGCSWVLADDAVRVRVMRAPEDRVEDADAHCGLGESFVVDHPVLERVLTSAKTAPAGEWVTTGTNRKTGELIVSDLREHCDGGGDVYHYDGDTFVVSVERNGESMFPDRSSPSSEAIRAALPHSSP
ncbi:hypothetical protein [Halobacterium wangiae]|uniref:hypothetical protein n=1 Tax=Halobacterium wangiae TaxID=2902623 RepID=UPI001E47222D|nr:hypothetical protein [Halobacterium wangiae]